MTTLNDEASVALKEARGFFEAGDFGRALERHVWFHRNALSIRPSLYGVRLSFALAGWFRLGEVFEPALMALREIRDEAVAGVLAESGTGKRELFHDVVSINEKLGEVGESVRVFMRLHEEQPLLAACCFDLVKKALLEADDVGAAGEVFCFYAGDLSAFMWEEMREYDEMVTYARSNVKCENRLIESFGKDLVKVGRDVMRLAESRGDAGSVRQIREMLAGAGLVV